MDFLVFLAHPAHLASVDRLVLGENPAKKESVDLKVLSVHLVLLGPLVPSVHLVTLDPPVQMANLDLLEFLDAQETRDHQVHQDQLEALDPLVFPDPLALPDLLAPLESEENEVKLAHRASKVLLDLEASLVLLVLRVRREKPEPLVQKAPKVIVVSLVYKVFPVLLVLKEKRVFLVLLAHLALLVSPVLKVHLDVMEALVLKVSWVHLVPVVLLVKKVRQVPLVLLVLLVLLVHLENLWATTPLLWQLSSDKANPRVLILYKETTQIFQHASSAGKSLTTSAESLLPRLMNSSRPPSRSSSNQKAPRNLLPRLAVTSHMPILNYQAANTGSILMRVIPRTPSWCIATWKRRQHASCLNQA